jgi:hypothetical protein
MSNYFYVKFGKYPGQIAKSMRTNVADVKGYDRTIDPTNREHRRAVHEGGRFWYWDHEADEPKRRKQIVLSPAADKVDVGQAHVISLEGVPDDETEVILLVNREHEVSLKRKRDGTFDTLILGWDQPTPVTVSLSQKNVTLRAEPCLVYFEEPENAEV